MLRFFDFLAAVAGLLLLSPVFLLLLLIGYFDTRSPLFFQQRVGRNQKLFKLVKFRTMRRKTPSVASHLVQTSSITKLGRFLRSTKLDELPQLINVLLGDMSLVGPRPNLPNQVELIRERSKRGVYSVLPGITGLAQIQNIDMSTPVLLAQTDAKMIADQSIKAYFRFVLLTVFGRGRGDASLGSKSES